VQPDCYGGEPRCVDVTMTKGYQYVASPSLYLYKGEYAHFDFQTNADSVHHVAFAVYNSAGTRVTSWKYASYAGGEDGGYFTVPSTGYYYLFAACKGGEATTCTGGGTLSYP
jgi:hypothetical protein